ncbi:MAG: InlB B-repeat-containing protein [Oscillospiraceae bacterium]|nr:InlB B-repeat-containing protein [Oscillospiraceae bacterium]
MKFSQIKFGFIALLIAVTVLFTSVSAFATSDTEGESESQSETVIISETKPDTEDGGDASTAPPEESENREPSSTESGETKGDNTPETKPAAETETRRNNNGSGSGSGNSGSGGNSDRRNNNSSRGNSDSDEETEDDGKFTVYIELNNGEERLKFDLEEESTVPQPQEKPERKGFKFAGWFSDPEFETPWDFSKDIAKKGTVIYVKWEPDEGTVLHKITVSGLTGGTLEVNPPSAAKGETVNITVKPENGKRLKAGSILINGEASDYLSFVMPDGDVVLSAEFEDIPKKEEAKSNKKLIVIICVAAAALVAAAVSFFVIRRKNASDGDSGEWVDDSIKLQEGFKDGRVVKPDEDDGAIVISDDDGVVIMNDADDIIDRDD